MIVDASKYIGIPFKEHGRDRLGLDCWGLLRLIYKEELGIELPSFVDAYESTDDGGVIGRLIAANKGEEWEPVESGKERAYDGILLRVTGQPMHVGVVVDRGEMVHVMKGIDVTLERYLSWRWKNRIMGFYRWTF